MTLAELSREEILQALNIAGLFKEERKKGVYRRLLENKSLAMILQKPSTRTRVSFEIAMYELGGHALSLGADDLQLSQGESLEDTGSTLSKYASAIMARVYGHQDIVLLAEGASVPVINGLSEAYHPCQILADLLTIKEHKNDFRKLKLAWIGDGNNVCNTMLIGCSKLGISMVVASPKGYEPLQEAVESAQEFAKESGSRLEMVPDPSSAAQDADIVATDTFVSMGMQDEKATRRKAFLPEYQVNSGIMKNAKANAIFMHCLPAHRGEEVTNEVIDSTRSVVWEEAENRLHVQKALLCLLLLNESQIRSMMAENP